MGNGWLVLLMLGGIVCGALCILEYMAQSMSPQGGSQTIGAVCLVGMALAAALVGYPIWWWLR